MICFQGIPGGRGDKALVDDVTQGSKAVVEDQDYASW